MKHSRKEIPLTVETLEARIRGYILRFNTNLNVKDVDVLFILQSLLEPSYESRKPRKRKSPNPTQQDASV